MKRRHITSISSGVTTRRRAPSRPSRQQPGLPHVVERRVRSPGDIESLGDEDILRTEGDAAGPIWRKAATLATCSPSTIFHPCDRIPRRKRTIQRNMAVDVHIADDDTRE